MLDANVCKIVSLHQQQPAFHVQYLSHVEVAVLAADWLTTVYAADLYRRQVQHTSRALSEYLIKALLTTSINLAGIVHLEAAL